MIGTGCARLLADPAVLRGRRWGLLGHGASITADCRPLHLALADAVGAPAALFGPEHGYYGVEQDMVAAEGHRDPLTGAPVLSLYGHDATSLKPHPEVFAGLDLLLVDLQDVGSRYYTYVATTIWAVEVALAAGVEVWVLDRPNPIGGERVEGPTVSPGYESFVGAFPTPVRHGMTLAELVRWDARRRSAASDGLRIFELEGWRRDMTWEETGLPWIAPSPNMPTPATAEVYPGLCLLEGTQISEGRGTTRPFFLLGAPGVDPVALARRIAERGARGLVPVPSYFRPQFQKHAGERCGGVELVLVDREALAPLAAGVDVLAAFHDVMGDAFAWRAEAYEFVTDVPAIDLLAGSDGLRRALDEGDGAADLAAWIATWEADEAAFREEREPALLYR